MPPELHRRLKARAAESGLTLSDYLLQELRDLVVRPTMREWAREAAALARLEVSDRPADPLQRERDR